MYDIIADKQISGNFDKQYSRKKNYMTHDKLPTRYFQYDIYIVLTKSKGKITFNLLNNSKL